MFYCGITEVKEELVINHSLFTIVSPLLALGCFKNKMSVLWLDNWKMEILVGCS